jgi:hypothetical protein
MKKYITGEQPKVGDIVKYKIVLLDSYQQLESNKEYEVLFVDMDLSQPVRVMGATNRWWACCECFELVRRVPQIMRVIKD